MNNGTPLLTSCKAIAGRRLEDLENLITVSTLDAENAPHTVEALLLEDIDALRSLSARFCRRLNRLRCPILRLPPEIIRLIIDTVVDMVQSLSYYVSTQKLIMLGHVCHDFRANLLGMHALWGRHAFAPDTLANHVFLERAQDAPIAIRLHTLSPAFLQDLAVQHLRRARDIDVSGKPLDMLVPGLQMQCFPLLDYLSLTTYATPALSLPQTFSAPNLRRLTLKNVIPCFNEHRLTNLVTLTLHKETADISSSLASTAQIVGILRSCAGLRELDLRGFIPMLNELPEEEHPKAIYLPSLRMLSLSQDRITVLHFWKMLIIPPTTTIRIDFKDERPDSPSVPLAILVEDTNAFAAQVTAYNDVMPPMSALRIHGVRSPEDQWWLSFGIFGGYCGVGTPHYLGLSPTEWTRIAGFYFTTDRWTEQELSAAIARFVSIFKLSQIAYLSVDCLLGAGLLSTYETFPEVRRLHLDYCSETAAFLPLSVRSDIRTIPPTPRPSVPCPALHTLYMSDNGASDDDEGFDFSFLRLALKGMLRSRSERGHPITVLGLEYDNVSDTDRQELLNFVDEIRVYAQASHYAHRHIRDVFM
ncbi:unnamed protein product [Peniophora sp. CBMAI 1063]|nr:unnamed protein product [Peniophora sp. CBMAI 1063]